MEKLYQESLKTLKKLSNNNDLKASYWSYVEEELSTGQEPLDNLAHKLGANSPVEQIEDNKEKSQVVEKTEILDSLYQFGSEKLKESGEKAYRFDGGEIKSKEKSLSIEGKVEIKSLSFDSLSASLKKGLGEVAVSNKFQDKNLKEMKSVKVVFVTDTYLAKESLNQASSELECFFEPEVALLFSRMVKAMELSASDYFVSGLQSFEGEPLEGLFYSEVALFRPQFIVTLGAQATNKVLSLNERLKDIHGRFYKLECEVESNDFSVDVMPLFSPNLLQTAPNMKKTAWKDMQALMERL